MHFLIGLCLAVALLYFWLIGHWFARVLVFLMLACVAFLAACYTTQVPGHPPVGLFFGLVAGALSWPIASLPIYFHRGKQRQVAMAWDERRRRLLSDDPVVRH